jgi:hypothetical protein
MTISRGLLQLYIADVIQADTIDSNRKRLGMMVNGAGMTRLDGYLGLSNGKCALVTPGPVLDSFR